MRSVLADVNLWLATIVDAHPHHQAAQRWWSDELLPLESPLGGKVAFCRVTQLGLLRLLTNEAVMGKKRQSVPEAWETYRQLLAQPPVVYLDEPPGLEAAMHELCRGRRSSKNFWTDAYLAAFARASAVPFVTFDRGFRKFSGVDVMLLTPSR